MSEIEEAVKNHFDESEDYLQLVDKLSFKHTKNLDELIHNISELLKQPDYSLDLELLQHYYLNICTELYTITDNLKEFEIYSALAKSNQSEAYNNAYIEESITADKKPAVAELQIKAELKSKKQSLVNTIYASAFKNIKTKVDAGNNVADALKHIIKVKTNLEYTANQTANTQQNRSTF